MTVGRNKAQDVFNTNELLAGRFYYDRIGAVSWLGHSNKAKLLDEMLLDGSSKEEMGKIRGAVNRHIDHLKVEHGLSVCKVNGIFKICVSPTMVDSPPSTLEASEEKRLRSRSAERKGFILEVDMEDKIAANPALHLGEEGLTLVQRQYRIGGYIFDMLFEDRHGSKLIVEIQRGTLDRNHTYKIFDYYDEYKEQNPREFVELMVVANVIPRERQKRLTSRGVSWREIPLEAFLGNE
ncbi:endonuclease NucS domain-containing protein [Fundidesulfovibrio agrisoli]|uniref:endonuclease NucS domain-containing protein n=1 Tax=Fundidesulfovibrio agrisoli TaxID=2922717 RepID=UPI001FABAB0E|nr:endonuclease NucS domain-containing protein [Fundidesulfovibrio agrisoli]